MLRYFLKIIFFLLKHSLNTIVVSRYSLFHSRPSSVWSQILKCFPLISVESFAKSYWTRLLVCDLGFIIFTGQNYLLIKINVVSPFVCLLFWSLYFSLFFNSISIWHFEKRPLDDTFLPTFDLTLTLLTVTLTGGVGVLEWRSTCWKWLVGWADEWHHLRWVVWTIYSESNKEESWFQSVADFQGLPNVLLSFETVNCHPYV